MVVRIEVKELPELRCEAHHPSGATVFTDAPVDNHGLGRSFSPTDLLATALLSCAQTTMAIRAQVEGWHYPGADGHVEKHMTTAPPRRVAHLAIELRFRGPLTPEAEARCRHLAAHCPVAKSLSADVVVDYVFRVPAAS